jgi:hypothetical protein
LPFGRTSSFTSGPWVNSHVNTVALSSTASLDNQNPNSGHAKEQTRSSARCLFTDQEVELLTRNSEGLLQLHEHFVQELSTELEPLGFLIHGPQAAEDDQRDENMHNADAAISIVSTKFATEVCIDHFPWCSVFDRLR